MINIGTQDKAGWLQLKRFESFIIYGKISFLSRLLLRGRGSFLLKFFGMLGKYYESNHNNESNHKKYDDTSKIRIESIRGFSKESY